MPTAPPDEQRWRSPAASRIPRVIRLGQAGKKDSRETAPIGPHEESTDVATISDRLDCGAERSRGGFRLRARLRPGAAQGRDSHRRGRGGWHGSCRPARGPTRSPQPNQRDQGETGRNNFRRFYPAVATGGGTLVHEIVHPFMAADFPQCPAWLNKGLGSLVEQCGMAKGRIQGFTNWRLAGLQEAIEGRGLPTFEMLCSTSSEEFYDDPNGTNYASQTIQHRPRPPCRGGAVRLGSALRESTGEDRDRSREGQRFPSVSRLIGRASEFSRSILES
mgnify:FL=1|jgi:hypothetical protein